MPSNEVDTVCQPEQDATALLLQGRVVEASRLLSDALGQCESSDRWNHWAVAELMLAERGFRRALEIDPSHAKAAMNLGILLFSVGRLDEAVPFLERSLARVTGATRTQILTLLGLCVRRLTSASTPGILDRDPLKDRIRHILEEYFDKGNRSSSVVTPEGFVPVADSNPLWIEEFMRKGQIHDQDYVVFGAFRDPESTILDVGAHFGYSVTSIWSSGAASSVISFEPNPHFEPCFQHIAKLRPGRYDYRLVALSESAGALGFAMPVVNGYGMGALTTACASPDVGSLAQNIVKYSVKSHPITSFHVHRFEAQAARLDDLLAAGGFCVPTNKIVAIKIDTEGYEVQILRGCPELLATQRPLVLAEGGHSNPLVYSQLMPLGYLYARRIGKQLQIVSGPAPAINGFFLHPAHADEYRRIGLLQQP